LLHLDGNRTYQQSNILLFIEKNMMIRTIREQEMILPVKNVSILLLLLPRESIRQHPATPIPVMLYYRF
jgi:hypothetical protein